MFLNENLSNDLFIDSINKCALGNFFRPNTVFGTKTALVTFTIRNKGKTANLLSAPQFISGYRKCYVYTAWNIIQL